MSIALQPIVDRVLAARGLAHKGDIAPTLQALGLADANDAIRVGDDCAALPDGDGWLLFAIEGFVADFVERDPFFAGYCGLMVNLSDIAAMGGRAIAAVDAVWTTPTTPDDLLRGLKAASTRYGVPIVGGHTNRRSGSGQLAVAVLGRARSLITSFDAEPGDRLVVAMDARGAFRPGSDYWDASSDAPAERLRGDLALLPELAEAGLVGAGKDISMAGLVGTTIMLAEASGCGATIDLAAVPCPAGVDLARFLLAFPSFGFVLAVKPAAVAAVLARFEARGIAAATVGTCDASRSVRVRSGPATATVWQGDRALVGCRPLPFAGAA